MIDSLPLFHRIAGQPVIVLGEGEAAEAKRRLVRRAGGQVVTGVQDGIDRGARLAFVAHDDPAAIEGDVIRLRCAGLLVNAVDRPELCDFTTPSILDRTPVLIAIGTGGASAGLAKALRLRLERLLPPSLGALAQALHAARSRLRERYPEAGDRRRALDAALGEGGALDPLREESADRVEDWMADSADHYSASFVEIRLRSDDPEDLTLREARWLGSADILAHEPGVPTAILDRARADAARLPLPVGTSPPLHEGLVVIVRV
ncbi:MAG: NAD(P)-dependent oxidoreductase [Novosphingobium sp.]